MTSWRKALGAILGASKPAPPPRKTVAPAVPERAALIKQGMTAYRKQRAQARDVLSKTLMELRGKAPSAMDPHKLVELMTLYRAHVDLKNLLSHDLKRYLVLVGIRELLGQGDKTPAPAAAVPQVKAVPSQAKPAPEPPPVPAKSPPRDFNARPQARKLDTKY